MFPSSQPDQREGPKMGFLCLGVAGGGGCGAGWMRSVCGCDVTAVCPCQLDNKSLKKRGDNTATVKPFGGGGSQTKRRPSGRWRGVPRPPFVLFFFTRDARHFQVAELGYKFQLSGCCFPPPFNFRRRRTPKDLRAGSFSSVYFGINTIKSVTLCLTCLCEGVQTTRLSHRSSSALYNIYSSPTVLLNYSGD